MSPAIPLFAFVVFWTLAAAVAFSPLRWAIPSYVLAAQIDLSGPAFDTTGSVGFENALKIVVLPLILLWRIGWFKRRPRGWPRAARIWLALVAYAGFSALWSDYRLPAVKMLGYLFCYTALFIVFRWGWQQGYFSARTLGVLAVCTLTLAALQTFAFGNQFGTLEGRFTGFSDPQGFAAFLFSVLALLLCHGRSRWWIWLTSLMLVAGILLAGSRYVFVGTMFLMVIVLVLTSPRSRQIRLRALLKRTLVGILAAALLVGLVFYELPNNRIQGLISLATDRQTDIEDLGTLAWRLSVYQEALDQLGHRPLPQLFFGSGTSSSADVLLNLGFVFGEFDPNRSMHNDFLRSLYEWGLCGLLLLLLGLWQLTSIAWSDYRTHRSRRFLALLGILPGIFLGLLSENVLTAAGQPAGTGYLLVLASANVSLLPIPRFAAARLARPAALHAPAEPIASCARSAQDVG